MQDLPAIFGLDASGTIEALGSQVLNLKVGDRVYVNPHLTCGTCHQCRGGRNDLCLFGALRGYFAMSESAELLNQYPIGALSQYLLSPASKVVVLPDSLDLLTAARLGYIGTSFGGLKKGNVGPGTTLLVNGATGTLGLAAVAIALGFGAVKIIGIGRNKERLAKLEEMSPIKGRIVTRSSEDEDDLVEWVKERTEGVGVDALYDCLGVGAQANTTQDLIRGAIKAGGRAVLAAGGAEGEISQPYWDYLMRDVAIRGQIWFTDQEAEEMVALIGAGVIDFSFLEHQTFPLAEVNEALSAAGDRPGGFSNVVVLLDEHQKAVSLFHLDMLSFEERVLSQTDPGVVLFFFPLKL
jgi:alcohol dehydrogenase